MDIKLLTRGFERPSRIEIDPEKHTPTYGRFIARPLEPGYGHTLGERPPADPSLLDYWFAVTSVRVEAPHEFSSIEGVVEDVAAIVLNEDPPRQGERDGHAAAPLGA